MISTLNLIPATTDDAPEICELLNIAYRSGKGWTTESGLVEGDSTSLEQVVAAIDDEDAFFLVHKELDKLVSCICVENIGGRIFIGSFAVGPDHQASGLGSATLAAAEAFAANKFGASQFFMTVLSNRPELVSFYERRGYRQTGKASPYPVHLNVGRPIVAGLTTEELVKENPHA
jgi:GNAT superfamily N-acetyltransferase